MGTILPALANVLTSELQLQSILVLGCSGDLVSGPIMTGMGLSIWALWGYYLDLLSQLSI